MVTSEASFLPVELLSALRLPRQLTALLFRRFLLEFTYLFIQIDSVRRVEPTV